MARVLFFPVFLIILVLAALLALRVKSMFSLGKSNGIILDRAAPFEGNLPELAEKMLESVKAFTRVEFQSNILVDFRKITSYSRTEPASGYCKITGKSKAVEITRANGKINIKNGKHHFEIYPGENQWIYYWCGVIPLEKTLGLFHESGMKVQAGNTGFYTGRKYIEVLVLSHALPQQANEAFARCSPSLSPVFGKELSAPGIRVRNLMTRILLNSLTYLPDYIETRFHIFDGENRFICDFTQNSRLLY